jgi:hypothetical protein
MAKMIPARYDEGGTSAAEKRIFHLLANDPDLADWAVIHSLGLARGLRGPYGEIDFVVLAPSGAVICLEIKGGRVSCKDGTWHTVDRSGVSAELKKSPFMQARDGMFSLFRAVQAKFGINSDAGRCLFAYAVIFPDIDPPPQTPEFERWEAISRDDLRSPISDVLRKLISAQGKKIGPHCGPHAPDAAVREIRQFLRPDFERWVTRSTAIRESEAGLISLTEDQYLVLDMISDNPRCLIEGAAGTGKTVLALEYARREASCGKRVALVCFNRLLGDWFEHRAKEFKIPGLTATSFFRFLRSLVISSEFRDEYECTSRNTDPAIVFSELLPFYAQLAVEAGSPSFDVLVMDEAQDLLNSENIDLIGAMLRGGMAGGSWYIFGDFTRQCIHGNVSPTAAMAALESRCPHFVRTRLRTNCRNTRRIGEETALLSGFTSPPYKLGQIDGLAVDYRYWKNASHQLEKLTEVVQQMISDGVDLSDVVLISSRKFADSVAAKLSVECPKRSVTAYELRSGADSERRSSGVGFATVQAFKGMESRAVIFCDVEEVENEAPQALLYTGMSRARSLLVMLVHESERGAIAKSLTRKLSEGWKS